MFVPGCFETPIGDRHTPRVINTSNMFNCVRCLDDGDCVLRVHDTRVLQSTLLTSVIIDSGSMDLKSECYN